MSFSIYLDWTSPHRNIHIANVRLPPVSSTTCVESFCLPHYHLTITYDAIPLSTAVLTIRPHPHLPDPPSNPVRLHYAYALHPYTWSHAPRDAAFHRDRNTSAYTAQFDLKHTHDPILGLSFVVQLATGDWLRAADESDFYIGGGERRTPCVVEMLFPHPPCANAVKGEVMSLYRLNPFWLWPQMDGSLENLLHETQFVLYASREAEERFVAILPLVDAQRGVRASLFGKGTCVALRLENGRCQALKAADLEEMAVCVVGVDVSPYEAVRRTVEAAAEIIGEFCSRGDKLASLKYAQVTEGVAILDRLGYCTWDAFGYEVTERMVIEAVRWFKEKGVKLGYAIIDDGWQGGGGAGPNYVEDVGFTGASRRPRLSSFAANDKFSGTLRRITEETGVQLIAWSAVIGYWGGCDGASCGVQTCWVRGKISAGLCVNNPHNLVKWGKEYELVWPDGKTLDEFFEMYFVRKLALEQAVSGVKVDAQSILEILCNTVTDEHHPDIPDDLQKTRGSIVASYRGAMVRAVEKAFPKSIVINCMGCGSESIFLSGKKLNRGNVCWRTSDDHAYPGVEENFDAVAWHIICNALNTVLLGEIFPVTDWDMFRVADESTAALHAAARVLSGGPVYISDATPISAKNDSARTLLASLTTLDGRLLRCMNPGRPTIDCLFKDPRQKPGRLFKIFNRTAVLSVLGLFNLNLSEDSSHTDGTFAPADVEEIARTPGSSRREYISLATGVDMRNMAFRHRGSHDKASIKIAPRTAVLVHICPVFEIADGIKVAVLGQPRLLNCGAAVASLSVHQWRGQSEDEGTFFWTFECRLEDFGETYIWLDLENKGTSDQVARMNGDTLKQRVVSLDDVTFVVADVPNVLPYRFRLDFKVDGSASKKENRV